MCACQTTHEMFKSREPDFFVFFRGLGHRFFLIHCVFPFRHYQILLLQFHLSYRQQEPDGPRFNIFQESRSIDMNRILVRDESRKGIAIVILVVSGSNLTGIASQFATQII